MQLKPFPTLKLLMKLLGKLRREVNAVSEILDENPAHFSSNIKKTRLLSSRHRALAAMEKIHPVTVTHLEQVSSGKVKMQPKPRGY